MLGIDCETVKAFGCIQRAYVSEEKRYCTYLIKEVNEETLVVIAVIVSKTAFFLLPGKPACYDPDEFV